MKNTEILQALNLTKGKETTNYCSKLANVFTLLKSIDKDIIKAEIVETNGSINNEGKLQIIEKIEANYKNSLLNKYKYNNKEIKELTETIRNLNAEHFAIYQLINKRNSKDNSELEQKKDSLKGLIKESEQSINVLYEAEEKRLQSVTDSILDMRKELELMEVNKLMVQTDKSNYNFWLPINNTFYYNILRLLNIPFEVAEVETIPVKYSFVFSPAIIDSIKKALSFTSSDDLRPAMTGVCLDFSNEGLRVIATDAHKMFYSKFLSFEGTQEAMKLIISPESVRAIIKTKKDEQLKMLVYSEVKASINGIDIRLIDARFPDYSVVIPKYKNFMEFNREQMITNVKKVLPYSNKCTSQVNLHLNGSIALHTQDVDFSFECDADMPYITKDFKDTDIAFNGTFLNTCLNSFKDTNVKMFTDGENSKAAIFSNGIDNVLLMPLMLNNY